MRGSEDCCNDNDAQSFDFGNPQIIATAGKTVAQATSVPEADNDQTTTSSQPTQVTVQDVSQATQSQQQDVSSSATEASSTGSSDEPEATDGSVSTKAGTSGDSTAKAAATQASQSDATGTIARTASQSDSANTASPVTGSGSDPDATDTANNSNNNNNNGSNNHTVAIAAGVGVGVGVVVFLLCIAACWHIRRKRQRPGLRSRNLFEIGESSTPAMEVADDNNNSGARLGEKGRGSNIYELDGGAGGAELPAGNEAKEVHGESADSKKWPDMPR
ncbi:uncharacterized protein N0V89_012144 [Didymosphaeria variabile]|uniref:Mid2 domain-containing protein n=1 Tax=Didymosphaeria variabile TaxID=1932322 RepID=A0A9W8X8L4_9PLEO|nr:uncharacterized protein N0V89_012144 [Didymosphaeria variabile]KAJ4344402.1 hypothetical protein N0V89_012144 [Didymosphaeria variabile]